MSKNDKGDNRQVNVKGTLLWPCLLEPAEMSGKHEVVVTNLSADDVKKLKAVGVTARTREDKPEYGSFVTPKANRPPLVVDWNRDTYDPEKVEKIGNGTVGNVCIRAFDYDYNGKKGVGAGLQAIQVLELKEYNPGSSFEVEDNYAPASKSDDVPF